MPALRYFYALLLLLLAGCASLDSRLHNAEALATAHGFTRDVVNTERFRIVTWQKLHKQNTAVTVYLEGDGYAFVDRVTVSSNPTPINAIGLKLAVLDNSDNLAYIARPCMYLDLTTEPHCEASYWTTRRYSPEVIQAISQAIDAIKTTVGADKIRLVGYSGGGTIAAILAAQRSDVLDLRTLAGNLDIEEFARYHKVTQLAGSLNPVDFATTLVHVPQRHYVGIDDNVIVRSITESYLRTLRSVNADIQCSFVEYLPAITHNKGWEGSWQTMDSAIVSCK